MHYMANEIWVKGTPLSPGFALGRPCFYKPSLPRPDPVNRGPSHEGKRLDETLAWMTERLAILAQKAEKKLGTEAGDVFRAHQAILGDPALRQRLFDAVASRGLDADGAVERHFDLYKAELQAVDFGYMCERAADIAELQRGLLDKLRGGFPSFRCKDMGGCMQGECCLGNDHIVVCPELTPSLTIDAASQTMGFIVEKGTPNSHATILARALGLPAVSGITQLSRTVPIDAQCLVDGDMGEVILNPSTDTLADYQEFISADRHALTVVEPVPELRVMANVDCAAGVRQALAVKAEGVGLSRTEIDVLAKGRPLTGAEQTARYSEVVQAMAGKPVFIRLLDLGGDKVAEWLGLRAEKNPALGRRGARLLLSRPELVRTQARALARASVHGPIHVVYPMILDLEQFRALRTLFNEAVSDLHVGHLLHGIMFEVPSACLQARELLEEADFACVGTNDLVQYLFATDRTDEDLHYEALLGKPTLWYLIERLAQLAEEAGKPLSLCGELARNTQFTRKIIDAGITTVSTNPRSIARVRLAAKGPAPRSGAV